MKYVYILPDEDPVVHSDIQDVSFIRKCPVCGQHHVRTTQKYYRF